MPRTNPTLLSPRTRSNCHQPFELPPAGRSKPALGQAGGLTDFGVKLARLLLGAWSSQCHWHSNEDEFGNPLSSELSLFP